MTQATLQLILRLKDEASKALQSIRGTLGSLGETARSAASSMGRIAAGTALGGVLALGGAIGGAAYNGLQFNNSMEQVTAQLNAFTKDGAKTADLLTMIRERAASTPFAFEDMATATAALYPAAKASGQQIESLIAQAEILAASNPAEGLEGAAFALKEALSGDFTSIIERFNLPRQRLNQLKEEGVPALEAVQIAMKELGLDADLVSGLANTASGRWSTLKDTFVGLASTVTQPIFDTLSGSLAGVNGMLEANAPLLQALSEQLAGRVQAGIAWLTETGLPALRGGWEQLQPALGTAREALDTIADAARDVVAVLSGGEIFEDSPVAAYADALRGLRDAFTPLLAAVQPVIVAFQEGGFRGALAAIPGAIGPVADAVMGLRNQLILLGGDALGNLLDGLADEGSFQSFLTGLGLSEEAAGAISETLRSLGSIVRQGAALFVEIGRQAADLVAPLGEAASGFGEMLAPHLAWFADFAATKVLPALRDIVAWLGPQLQGVIKVVGPLLTGLVDLGLSVLQLALAAIATTWDTLLKPAFESLSKWLGDLTGGWDQVARGAEKVAGWLTDISGAIRDIASGNVGFDQIVRGWNSLFGGSAPAAPSVPGFASGVQNFAGGLAYVHAGELLTNLPPGTDVIPAPQTRNLLGGGGSGGAGAAPITVVVQGSVMTERDLVDVIWRGLLDKARSNPDIFGGRA